MGYFKEMLAVFQRGLVVLWRNKILLVGTVLAQLVHIGAMYTPWIRDVLHIQPISLVHWLQLLGLALSVLVVMELHKLISAKFR